jgi:hypothetical protein
MSLVSDQSRRAEDVVQEEDAGGHASARREHREMTRSDRDRLRGYARIGGRARRRWLLAVGFVLFGCETPAPNSGPLVAQQAIAIADFAALVERVSETGGYFDTDNLISNETGYLNVIDALAGLGATGGAYVGVGPDQNFSYIAEVRPHVAFVMDIRRDNLLHHLLLKALVERSETRVEFLSALHGVVPPTDLSGWDVRDVNEIIAWVDDAWRVRPPRGGDVAQRLVSQVRDAVRGYGLDLSDEDFATIERFHRIFMDAGLGLRFTSFGRAPRPYYPTYRQLTLETDADGDQVSYLASAGRYGVVRELQLANRIVPVVGDMAGSHALREIGYVLQEMELELTTFYTSNVEFYLWQSRTFGRWRDNLAAMPAAPDAVVVRSYFRNFGGAHPSAVSGYYAAQTLQPVSVVTEDDFSSYWDLVTRGVLELR